MSPLYGWEVPGIAFSLPANIDMSSESAYQWTPVTAVAASGAGISTPTACAPVAATGDPMVGVLQNNPQLAEAADIVVDGISKGLLGGVVAVGDQLMACPLGGFQKATSGNYIVAQALDSGVSGSIIAILLVRNGKL